MEKIVNNFGSSTVESLLVIPVVLITVSIFIVLMISAFQFSEEIINVHEQALMSNRQVSCELNRTVLNTEMKWQYTYNPPQWHAKELQNIIEYLIYMVSEYKDRLKGNLDE